jgi:hypothetical protein
MLFLHGSCFFDAGYAINQAKSHEKIAIKTSKQGLCTDRQVL